MPVVPLVTPEVLAFVDGARARDLALTPPLTSDHLIRTKALPLWIDPPPWDDTAALATDERLIARDSNDGDWQVNAVNHHIHIAAVLAEHDPAAALGAFLGRPALPV